MNPFLILYYTITNNLRSAEEWVKNNGTHTKRIFTLAVLIPLAILIIGIGVDVAFDTKAVIVAAGFLNALWLLYTWGRASILVHVLALASRGADVIWKKIPEVSLEEAGEIVRKLRGVTLLIMIPWVLALTLPIRENVGAFIAALTFLMLVSGVAFFRNWDGKLFWTVYALYGMYGFALSIMLMVSPDSSERIRNAVSYRLALFWDATTKGDSLAKAELDARAGEVDLDKALLERKFVRKEQIKLDGIEKCQGKICPAQLPEYLELVEDINKLKANTYWPAEPAKAVEKTEDSAQNAQVSSLPPPDVKKIDTGDKDKAQPEPTDQPVETASTYEEDVDSVIGKYAR